MDSNLKEMLELAAKAEGRTLRFNSLGEIDARYPWAPHADDGDSRRLEVALGMCVRVVRVCPSHGNPRVEVSAGSIRITQGCGNSDAEYEVATRLAVLRAAAEIGRAMP